ncbi:MAG: hypothetical protein EBX60_09120, partial [Betaproteobacteria bacterium]|nr:hypothetical protein [Betaproteobacteria bacterium]
MQRRFSLIVLSAVISLAALPSLAQTKAPVKIALIASKTGPLEAYAKQSIVGFNMGLAYATNGTMTVCTTSFGGNKAIAEVSTSSTPDGSECSVASMARSTND